MMLNGYKYLVLDMIPDAIYPGLLYILGGLKSDKLL